MAYFLEPGHIAMVMLTPEQYSRLYESQGPNLWPVYFGARFAAQTIQDLALKAIQVSRIEDLKTNLDLMIGAGLDVATDQAAAGPTGDVPALREDIKRFYGGLYDNWKAGIWQGMGSAYASAMDDFINTGQMIYALKTLAYHIAITPRLRRHWNKTFTPMVPNAAMSWVLYRRGKFTKDEFVIHAAYDGWDKEGAQQLIDAMQFYPTPRDAFNMWLKGLVKEEARDSLYFAGGLEEEWHELITKNWLNIPTPRDAFWMWTKGLITGDERDVLYKAGGYDKEWWDNLTENWLNLPSPHEAFYLWTKGLIKVEQRDALYKAGGYDAAWHPMLTDNWYYTPSIYDLTRIADYVELDQIWALDVMKMHGVKERDRAKIWEMLEVRPLREEIRALTSKWLWRYRYGRATLDQLGDAFDDLGVKTKEKKLLIEKAQLDYEDELIDEWIEILRWRFRTAMITDEEFLDGLVDLGICLEKANLIVEGEKAKGYYGYY